MKPFQVPAIFRTNMPGYFVTSFMAQVPFAPIGVLFFYAIPNSKN